MKIFSDVSSLAAATLTADQIVKVKSVGDYRIQDSGAGITLANGKIAVPQASGTAISVKQFGAVGDGVTDDTAALQAAIDSNTYDLILPSGTYLINSQINYTGVGLKGAGKDRTVISCAFAGVQFKKTSSTDRTTIQGITFTGNGTNTGFGSDGSGAGWFRSNIENCRFNNFSTGIDIEDSVLFELSRCDFDCTVYGAHFNGTYNNNVTLSNCFFRNATDVTNGTGCFINMPSEFEGNNFTFIQCAFDDCRVGFKAVKARVNLVNCSAENHTTAHFSFDNCDADISGGYLLGEGGTGVSIAYELDNVSIVTLSGRPRLVDNFLDTLQASNSSRFVSTAPKIPTSSMTVDATSTVGFLHKQQFTYTPTVYGASVTGTGTYSVQSGTYEITGNKVDFSVRVVWSAHTGSGGMRISLPVNTQNTSGLRYSYAVYMATATFTGSPIALALENANHIRIRENVSGGAVTDVSLPSSGELVVTGHYYID